LTCLGPVLLTATHEIAVVTADVPALDERLMHRALSNQSSGSSRTWVVTEKSSNQVVAFYASSTDSVLRVSAPRSRRRNQPAELPAILLARMAVDIRHRGVGLGAALLKLFLLKAREIGESVGVRLVLVHAKEDSARSFYEHYGFLQSPMDSYTLIPRVPHETALPQEHE